MTLLEQLKLDLPDNAHREEVYFTADPTEAERIAGRVRELYVPSIRYVMKLERFERRPDETSPKRVAYDVLVAALEGVIPTLKEMPAIEGSRS